MNDEINVGIENDIVKLISNEQITFYFKFNLFAEDKENKIEAG